MKYKNKKLLFLLSQNCRESLKNIGTELKQSEQTTSYQITKLEKSKEIKYKTTIDYIKLGFTNIIVGLNLKVYNNQNKQAILSEIKKEPNIVTTHLGKNGIDFIIEYKGRNLSHFNKFYSEFMHNHHNLVQTKFVLPIIVRHHYPRNYLIKNNIKEDIVTLGDRELEEFSEEHMTILDLLEDNPKITLLELSNKTKIGIKKAVKLKRDLEKAQIIRKYTAFFDYQSSDIYKRIVFVRLKDETYENINMLTEFARQNPQIINLTKLIGHYNVMIDIEFLDEEHALEQLRETFSVEDYLIVNVLSQL